jgi:predicted nucleic acid-binding protein
MSVDPTTQLFFDATCLFAAAHSPSGGSAYLVLVCSHGFLQAVVSPEILVEAERNLIEKSTTDACVRYRHLIASTPLRLMSAPDEPSVRQHASAFFEDAHVVASAIESGAHYLITLDQRLARRIDQAHLPIVAVSPRQFLQEVLPNHPEYVRIRRTVT